MRLLAEGDDAVGNEGMNAFGKMMGKDDFAFFLNRLSELIKAF